ncbi:APC family permease [Novosphingobium sp. FSW06-99]|uniref:APC family permease n=1 Tax=Novosphingobium sp. FSW06-99 TaxID=1739113 RepID=UPI0009EBA752|nr:APC family permease [Novosphingobium sp. FSW06-99]
MDRPPRVMGVADLALFYIVTGISLRWIASAATLGPSALWYWALAFAGFYIPLVAAVIELSSRYPQEGGLYVWIRETFGPFAGFMAGWSYWTSNLPYFPSVFYFDAGNALFLGGARMQTWSGSTTWFMSFALIALAAITAINIVGLKWAKWLHGMGAVGMWLPTLIIVMLAAFSYHRFGSVTRFDAASARPAFDLSHIIILSGLAFALSGPEAASFMSGEIRDPRRTIPRALPLAGMVVLPVYLLGTIAVLVIMPAHAVNPLQGLVQAGSIAAQHIGMGWLAWVVALLITVGNLGAASGYLSGCARLPFAVGIDHMLPPVFAKVHPRWGTPWVALLLQGGLGALFCVLGQAGTGVQGAYEVLVSMGIIAAFLPFAGVFLAVLRINGSASAAIGVTRLPGGRTTSIGLALVGLITTLVALVLAALPAADEANKPLALAKIVVLTAILLGAGAAVYRAGRRRA